MVEPCLWPPLPLPRSTSLRHPPRSTPWRKVEYGIELFKESGSQTDVGEYLAAVMAKLEETAAGLDIPTREDGKVRGRSLGGGGLQKMAGWEGGGGGGPAGRLPWGGLG